MSGGGFERSLPRGHRGHGRHPLFFGEEWLIGEATADSIFSEPSHEAKVDSDNDFIREV